MPDAIKTLLAIVPGLLCGLVGFFASFAVSGALWFNLGSGLLAFAAWVWIFLRHSAFRAAIAIGGAVCLLGAVMAPTLMDRLRSLPSPESDDLVRKIRQTAIPLASVDAGQGFADLAALSKIWQGARVVALGEATHGTSEFFRMKHRLTEFLVTQMGFRHFAMEMDERGAKPIDEYIQGQRNENPVRTLNWPWRTQEFAATIDWMRRYNQSASAAERVHFYGIDYQGERRDFRMAQNMFALLERLGPESRVILSTHNAHASSGAGWMGSYLKHRLGNQIYLTGFEFHHGRFTSNLNWVRTYEADAAGNGYYAAALARLDKPIWFLDFRTMEADPDVDAWLQQPHFAHELQEMHGLLRLYPKWVRTEESWPSLFDGVVFISGSSPAHLL